MFDKIRLHEAIQSFPLPGKQGAAMRQLFSRVFGFFDVLRRIIINGVFVLMMLVLIALIFVNRPSVPVNAVLVINPQGKLVEELEAQVPNFLALGMPTVHQARVRDITDAIKAAKDDERIVAMRLDLDAMGSASLAKLQIIAQAVESFRQSGKPVLAEGYSFSQGQYYLAATANKVFLNPLGVIELSGIAVYQNYFKDALDSLGVDMHIFRAGRYKAAVEPLMRNDMSADSKSVNQAWMDVMWTAYKQDIAKMRGIEAENIQKVLDRPADYIKRYHGDVAQMLLQEHLVDVLADSVAADQYLAAEVNWAEEEPMPEIDFQNYLHAANPQAEQGSGGQIAVITASGTILAGAQPSGSVGSDTLSDMLRQVRLDDAVKGVVLRVDSPGGSALASEVIRQSLIRLNDSGKPLVVSMGSVAASGGYWISAGAKEIWAQPTTITGSIGVFGMIPNVTRGLGKLGIHTDGLGTTATAGAMRPDKPMPDQMKAIIQMGVDHTYQRFLTLVAESRNMGVEQVDELAQGRVWSGLHAQQKGLVDKLGGLDEAIAATAKYAGLKEDYSVKYVEPPKGPRELLAEALFGEADTLHRMLAMVGVDTRSSAAPWYAKAMLPMLEQVKSVLQLNDPNHVYALVNIAE